MVIVRRKIWNFDDPDIARWSTYIGQGAIRFYLPLDQQLENPYYAQLVIVSKGVEERGDDRAPATALAR